MPKKKTLEETIADFRKVHGDRYDYSKVDYVNANTKVLIICPVHGVFWQIPSDHKIGRGCSQCGIVSRTQTRTLTTQQIIEDFQKVHGDRYDYSKVNYVNAHAKVLIICPEHGEFTQKPNHHKKGHGCPECGSISGTKSNTLTTQQVIKDFQKVHGDRYDYSKVDYKNTKTKVTIICQEHGVFLQRPADHKKGDGCPKCSAVWKKENKQRKKTNKQILHEFRKVHGDRYDYSKVEYVSAHVKVLIICPEHGVFWQTASSHKKGRGCPECGNNQISEPLFRECLETFMSRFGKFEFPNTRPDWLRNPETGYKLELDCYNEELGLAFELQGGQHYKPIKCWGGEKEFVRTIRRDVHKRTECSKHGVELFRIDNRPVKGKRPDTKKKYYEKQIRKCLNKAPKDVKLKLLNANKKE
jgi:protein-arginine kinase activator protein McsA